MDIADQLQQIGFFLAENGFIAVLEQLTMPPVPFVEGHGIAGEQTPHGCSDGGWSGSQQEMKMIGDERPGKAGGGGINQDSTEAFQEVVSVTVITEDFLPLDTAADNMVQGTRRIDACLARHDQ